MTILEKLRTELTQTVISYSRKLTITKKIAQEVGDLLKIISSSQSAVELHRDIKRFLPKMGGARFIIDFNGLRRKVLAILNNPNYDLFRLLFVENTEMRNEMHLLKVKAMTPKLEPESLKPMTDRLTALENSLQGLQQQNLKLATENKLLCEQLTLLEQGNKTSIQEKGKLEASLDELHTKYLGKVEECRTLREELKALTGKEVAAEALVSSKS
ncbi:MAG: hypothetical protein JSS53_06625 [Proteobacteria bacterium]|nr:hypothetical protein [Pseudomonadota bacterium]